jgi:hypothetical protein
MSELLNILERDRTGKCEGECRNRVLESMRERQIEILGDSSTESPDFYPNVPWATSRNEQPGVFGGHV